MPGCTSRGRHPLHRVGTFARGEAKRRQICNLERHGDEWLLRATPNELHARETERTLAVIDEGGRR